MTISADPAPPDGVLPPPDPAQVPPPAGVARRAPGRTVGLLVTLGLLLVVVVTSIVVGARDVPLAAIWSALTEGRDATFDSGVILDQRIPRTMAGLVAGLGLGVAGALMQAVTRNPLADPGILGVSAGAAFAVAIAVGVVGISAPSGYVWFAFAGALLATVFVYFVGASGSGPTSPARLTLAGVALGAVLAGITRMIVLADPKGFNAMLSWESGTLVNRDWAVMRPIVPFIVAGLVLSLVIGKALNAVALGDDLAASLGANVLATRVLTVAAVTLLAGGATAIAGPISFIGLMIPHVARWIVGPDQRWIIAFCALLGPILLLSADILGRVVLTNGELPAGIVTAGLGAPVLIYLVRRTKASGL